MSRTKYHVERVLNNNSILVKESDNKTKILTGKGIGFGHRINTDVEIDDNLIEKVFFNYDETLKNQLIHIITSFDEDIIHISNQIIKLAEAKFGELNSHIYVSLTDHISFTLDRLKDNQIITNPFQSAIQMFLHEEYKIAEEAKKIIFDKCNIMIPDEEVGFIAFHINAARENIKVNYVVQEMRIYKTIIQMIEDEFRIQLSPDKCADLYLIIQAHVKNEPLPMQFLLENVYLNYALDAKKSKLLNKIIHYIENNTTSSLSKNQKLILTAYLEYII